MPKIEVRDLKLIDYEQAWELQKKLLKKRIDKEIPDTLLIVEHPPVITYGKSSKGQNLIIDIPSLTKHGIKVFEVERGGDITYHEPGQLVAYPILDLNQHKRDVHWYMRMLEEVVINSLLKYNINGFRIESKTGVWTNIDSIEDTKMYGKIASLGVKLSKWCSMHGIALNVCNSLKGFNFMHPCGLEGVKMVSMKSIVKENDNSINVNSVKEVFLNEFLNVFNY